MLKNILPYVIIFLAFWYLPEIFLATRNLAASLFQESQNRSAYKVEIKVVSPLPYLPEKYSVITTGKEGLRVELNGVDQNLVRSAVTDESGEVLLEDIPGGKYLVRIAPNGTYLPEEIIEAESSGQSTLEESSLLKTSYSEVTITKDMYIVPILR